jgi:peptide/nickel transport system substrate-binding protein
MKRSVHFWRQFMTLCSLLLMLAFVASACAQPGAIQDQVVGAQEQVPATQDKEAPMLAEQVAAGTLPPLEERLPENPVVSSAPELGVYGGTISFGGGGDTPWNPYVPVDFSPSVWALCSTLFTLDANDPKAETLQPDLAERFETSEDGKTITIYLRQGVKWSDGEPFTVDDILFTYNDVIRDPQFTGGQTETLRANTTVGGEPVTMEKVDDYTFQVVMAEPSPGFVRLVFAPMGWDGQFVILPKHEMMDVHPKYNPAATAEDWNSARLPSQGAIAVLGPWVPVSISGDTQVLERNPYYWWVDQEGRQLPYLDRFVWWNWKDSSTAALAMISGELSVDPFGWGADQVAVLKESEADRPYSVIVFDAVRPGAALMLNYDTPDESLRSLFRDTRFKGALNLIIDREPLAEQLGILYAPYTSPLWPATEALLPPDIAAKYHVQEDRDRGLQILDELGIEDTDGDGWREFPAGTPKAGQPFEFIVSVASEETFRLRAAEEVKYQLEGLGIQVVLNAIEGTTFQNNLNSGNYDVKSEGFPENFEITNRELMLVRERVPWMVLAQPGLNPQYQPLTAEQDILPWQAEWLQVMEEYAAGTIEQEAAFTQAMEIVAANYPIIPLASYHFLNVMRDDIGNNPMDYLPNIRQTYWPLPVRDRFEMFPYLHLHEWYYKQ